MAWCFSFENARPTLQAMIRRRVKIIGKKKELTPVERLRAHARLNECLNRLRPFPRVGGKILRFKSWTELKFHSWASPI